MPPARLPEPRDSRFEVPGARLRPNAEILISLWLQSRWRTHVRPQVIERDKGVCQECGATGARQVAHIIDRRAGGPDDPSNLRLLCDSCHSRETAQKRGLVDRRRTE